MLDSEVQEQIDHDEDWVWYRAVQRAWYRREPAELVASELFLPVAHVRRLYELLDKFWPGMAAARVKRERDARRSY